MPDPEDAIQEAIARGDFENLPGAGKPLRLPAREDPDWWIRRRVQDGDVDPAALLPVVMLLRREAEAMDETLAGYEQEHLAREHLQDYNARVIEDRRENRFARILAPTLDVEERMARWRERRRP